MTLVTPADAKGPVPVMIMFRGGSLPQAPGAAAAAARAAASAAAGAGRRSAGAPSS